MEELEVIVSAFKSLLSSYQPHFKAVHIVGVVCWFSGLFYVGRLFIYQTLAQQSTPEECRILTTQYKKMARRLWYIITWPSAVLTLLSGLLMLPFFWTERWMHTKLFLVLLLFLYHLACHRKYVQLSRDEYRTGVFGLRLFNEGATVLLVAIVFVAVLKHVSGSMQSVLWLFVLGAVLFLSVRGYHRKQKSSPTPSSEEEAPEQESSEQEE